MIAELEEKVNFLEDLRARGVKRFAEVSQAFKDYHAIKIPGAPSGVEVAPRAPAEAIVVSIEDRLLELAQEKAAESSEEEVERS
jgi:hypothetical protein